METKLPKKVRVEKCSSPQWWYENRIGDEFRVVGVLPNDWTVELPGECIQFGWGIYKADCTPIYEEDEAKEENPSQESPFEKQVGGTHYKGFAIQPAHFIHANGIGFLAGNVIKYVARYGSKNGLEDLKKAKHYIDLLIAEEYPEHPSTHE